MLCCSRFRKPVGAEKPPAFGGTVSSPEGYLLALWIHECRRVFSDKLVTQEDKNWVDKTIADLCKNEFTPELCKQVRRGAIHDSCAVYVQLDDVWLHIISSAHFLLRYISTHSLL